MTDEQKEQSRPKITVSDVRCCGTCKHMSGVVNPKNGSPMMVCSRYKTQWFPVNPMWVCPFYEHGEFSRELPFDSAHDGPFDSAHEPSTTLGAGGPSAASEAENVIIAES